MRLLQVCFVRKFLMKITKKMKKLKNKSEYLNVSKKVIFSGAAGEKPIFFIDILKWFEKCGGEIYD